MLPTSRTAKHYLKLTKGVPCPCLDGDRSRCLVCYGTGFIGGYEEGYLLEVEKVHVSSYDGRGNARLLVKNMQTFILPGDLLIYKGKRRKVLDIKLVMSKPVEIYELEYESVSSVELATKFPVKEVV
jgi:hypothetical protein